MMKKLIVFLLLLSTQVFSSLLNEERKPARAFESILNILSISPDQSPEAICLQLTDCCFQKKERWEFESRFEEQRGVLIPLLRQLGLFKPFYASVNEYDYALVLGALRTRVQERIDFLVSEWKRGVRFLHIVFITGERPLRPSENCCNLMSEAEMMEYVWNQTPMPEELRDVPLQIVDCSAAPGCVRTTSDRSLRFWLESDPIPGTCLVFSSQPYAQYQDLTLRSTLPSSFLVETVSAECEESQPMSILMDTLARWFVWTLRQAPVPSK